MTPFKLALLTGASGGIGKELQKQLKARGIPLIALSRKEADLGTEEGKRSLFHILETKAPDLVINNAGFGLYGDTTSLSLEEQKQILLVNALSVLEITQKAAQEMQRRKQKGVILNVSSVAGEFPTPGMAVYGASKAFVTQFSQAMDYECAPFGVRILVSLPGQVSTHFAAKAAKKEVGISKWAMSPAFAAKEILKQIDRRKQTHAFDWRYRGFLVLIRTLLPQKMVMKTIYNSLQERL